MLALLALASIEATYDFPVEKPLAYEMEASFSGYLPVFGGRDADVSIKMAVEVTGKAPDPDGRAQVTSELKAIKALMNGAELPLTIDNFKGYFPKTTVSITPQGKVVKTDAPNIQLPVRLPALDVKRFPDISYVPIEFPAGSIKEGESWTFKKSFGGSDMTYVVKPGKVEGESVMLTLQLSQRMIEFEDQYGNKVEKSEGASRRVTTDTVGEGSAVYDRTRKLVTEFMGTATSTGKIETMSSGATKDTKLVSRIKVKLAKG